MVVVRVAVSVSAERVMVAAAGGMIRASPGWVGTMQVFPFAHFISVGNEYIVHIRIHIVNTQKRIAGDFVPQRAVLVTFL
jgi:hypothetical protein